MRAAVIAFTANGAGLARTIISGLTKRDMQAFGFLPERFAKIFGMKSFPSLEDWTKTAFSSYDALIFIGAVGIAVRAIAPHTVSKAVDPAVICVDELGRFVIPMLSGHIGGANKLSEAISEITGGTQVLTTATDINKDFAVDSWAVSNGYSVFNTEAIKHVSSAILEGRTVGLACDFPVDTAPPKGVSQYSNGDVGISISLNTSKMPFSKTLCLVPKCIDVGMGCRRDTPLGKLDSMLIKTLDSLSIPVQAVGTIASIDLKADEQGLISLARKYKIDYVTYSKMQLGSVVGDFSQSEFVESVTGVSSVCERAAVCVRGGELILPKTTGDSVTIAIAKVEWRVSF